MTIVQHELFPDDTGISRELLYDLLSDGSRVSVRLTVTSNRVSMASVSFAPEGTARVRLHERFLRAPRSVIGALARYLRGRDGKDWEIVAAFARSIVSGKRRPARRMAAETAGRVYDLKEVKNDVNRSFFNGRVACGIEWAKGRATTPRSRSKSIRYGSWDAAEQMVRIHPFLDDARVPYEFLRYIVFHEMLHAIVPVTIRGGERSYHPPTFRSLERSFPDVGRMHALAKQLVGVLR